MISGKDVAIFIVTALLSVFIGSALPIVGWLSIWAIKSLNKWAESEDEPHV